MISRTNYGLKSLVDRGCRPKFLVVHVPNKPAKPFLKSYDC